MLKLILKDIVGVFDISKRTLYAIIGILALFAIVFISLSTLKEAPAGFSYIGIAFGIALLIASGICSILWLKVWYDSLRRRILKNIVIKEPEGLSFFTVIKNKDGSVITDFDIFKHVIGHREFKNGYFNVSRMSSRNIDSPLGWVVSGKSIHPISDIHNIPVMPVGEYISND